jgi:hypothetical protein
VLVGALPFRRRLRLRLGARLCQHLLFHLPDAVPGVWQRQPRKLGVRPRLQLCWACPACPVCCALPVPGHHALDHGPQRLHKRVGHVCAILAQHEPELFRVGLAFAKLDDELGERLIRYAQMVLQLCGNKSR